MYVILGATGNTGSVVARKLLDKGKKVRVVGRDNKKLAPFVSRGAEAFATDVLDTDALSRAFAGAEGVYVLIPPDVKSPDYRAHQEEVSDSIAKALKTAGVTHTVTLSSYGADKPDKTGPVVALHNMETKLARISGTDWRAERSASARRVFHGKHAGASWRHSEFRDDGGAGSRGSFGADDRHERYWCGGGRGAGAAGFQRPADAGAPGAKGHFVQRGGKNYRCGDWEADPGVRSIAG